MYKLPKIVLILEPDNRHNKTYAGILESSGFLVRTVEDETQFYEDCIHVVPDIIVINSTHENVLDENIIKRLRKHPFMKNVPIVLLVTKMGFNATTKAKALKGELEEFPLKNNKFLQTIKKISKTVVMPQIHLEKDNTVESEIFADLEHISEMHLSFLAPIKMDVHCHIQIKAKLLDFLGIVEKNFEACQKGFLHESKQYKNEVSFRGLSVEVLRDLKKYLAGNREK
jgi:DNA-binding NtrC family response regulator